jgi:hypothetical protein
VPEAKVSAKSSTWRSLVGAPTVEAERYRDTFRDDLLKRIDEKV